MIWNQTVFLCLVWAVTILYGEMFAFWLPSLWKCSWPSPTINGVEYSDDYVKIAVLADPQLMDKTSHHLAPKSLGLEIAQFYTDIFMRRAFLASVMPLKPDVVLFLGDYFDGGLILSDEEWLESLNRLKHIFDLEKLKRTTNRQVYFISGNHDIGYAAFHSHRPEVIRRYENEFGVRNYRFTAGKVEFVAIDAQTLDGSSQGNQTSATWNFVKNVSRDSTSSPRVLLTHIPLYRPDWTYCGPHRSSSVINQRISRAARDQEILYQNYITEEASNILLDYIRPILVLSGHDHDQCTVTHKYKQGPVVEHTLGTISWQQGNLYPSFMLLSASNHTFQNASSVSDAISTRLCFLPAQTFIYIWYLSLFVLTLLVVLLWPMNGIGIFRHVGDLTSNVVGIFKGSKEKDEDENCEYEMVWDAEGSMHLIKKALKTASTGSSERVLVERGSAVMRSTAKKQIMQEIEVSLPVDTNSLPSKTKKSKAKMVIRRLVRTLRVLTVVAAVNLPIYMMLLFKDWVDK